LELSQTDLGNRIDPPVDKGTVSRWEKTARAGKVSTAIVAAYAEALNRHPIQMLSPPPPADAPAPLDAVAKELGLERDEAITALEIRAGRRLAS
jgi:transcriptional regulator with XRE-family HTH domain